jgi:hypothetical protein
MAKKLSFTRRMNGIDIQQRRTDGYFNATAMSKAYQVGIGQRRDVTESLDNKRVQQSITHLSLKTGIPVFKLVESKAGRYGGTWIHPKLAVRFAIWLSDEFGYFVEEWFEEWLVASHSQINPDLEQQWVIVQQRYDLRIHLKDCLRPELMMIVVDYAVNHRLNPQKLCSGVHDAMNERLQGYKSRDLKVLGGLPLGVLLRDYFEASPLVDYSAINRLAKNLIQDKGVEPIQAVHEACDSYLGRSYRPQPVKITGNIYQVRQKVLKARNYQNALQEKQLSLFDSQAS